MLPRWNRPCGGFLRVTHDSLAGVAPRTFRALVGNFSLPTKTRPPVLTDRQIRPEGEGDTYQLPLNRPAYRQGNLLNLR